MAIVTYYIVETANNLCRSIINWDDTYTYTPPTGYYVVTTAGGIVDETQWTGSAWSFPSGTNGIPGSSSGITSDEIADAAVILSKLDRTGLAGKVLVAQGVGNAPVWGDAASSSGGATYLSTNNNVTLTATSNRVQLITFTKTGLIITLPNATTLPLGGPLFQIGMDGFGCTIVNANGAIVASVASGQVVALSLVDNSTSSGDWISNNSSLTVVEPATSTIVNSANDPNDKSMDVVMMTSSTALVAYSDKSSDDLNVIAASRNADGTWTLGTNVVASVETLVTSVRVVRLTDTTAMVCYNSSGVGSYAVGVTLSGLTVTASAKATLLTSTTTLLNICFHVPLSTTTSLVGYETATANQLAVRVVTHAGASAPTLGTAVNIASVQAAQEFVAAIALSSTKVLLSYIKGTATPFTPACRFVTISGTTVTLGTEVSSPTTVAAISGLVMAQASATEVLMLVTGPWQAVVNISGANPAFTTTAASTFLPTSTDVSLGWCNGLFEFVGNSVWWVIYDQVLGQTQFFRFSYQAGTGLTAETYYSSRAANVNAIAVFSGAKMSDGYFVVAGSNGGNTCNINSMVLGA